MLRELLINLVADRTKIALELEMHKHLNLAESLGVDTHAPKLVRRSAFGLPLLTAQDKQRLPGVNLGSSTDMMYASLVVDSILKSKFVLSSCQVTGRTSVSLWRAHTACPQQLRRRNREKTHRSVLQTRSYV